MAQLQEKQEFVVESFKDLLEWNLVDDHHDVELQGCR